MHRTAPRWLHNTADIELWPAGLLRARRNDEARLLARAGLVLRRKRDGRYLAACTADAVHPLVPALGREPGLDAALDVAMQTKPERHDFDIAAAAPAVTRHMSVTGG